MARNLKELFFKPPWEHKDSDKRVSAVAQSDDPRLVSAVPELATADPDSAVRICAIQRLDRLEDLKAVLEQETHDEVLASAAKRITKLLAQDARPEAPDTSLLDSIKDASVIEEIAATAAHVPVRRKALERASRERCFRRAALEDPDRDLRSWAVEQIERPEVLDRIAEAARKTDKVVRAAATDRAKALRLAAGDQSAVDAEAKTLLEAAEQALKTLGIDERENVAGRLRRELDALPGTPSEELVARLTRFMEGFRRKPGTPQASKRTGTPTAQVVEPEPEPAQVPSSFAKLCAQAEDALGKNPTPKTLRRLQTAWRKLLDHNDSPASDERTRFDKAIMGIEQSIEARKAQRDAQAEQLPVALTALESALQEGSLQQARKAHHELAEMINAVEGAALLKDDDFRSRLYQTRKQLHEMRDWQHWANNKIRARLCEEAQSLLENKIHPDAAASKLKELRRQWDELSASEQLAGDNQHYNPSPGLTRKFRGICGKVHKETRPFFAKRDEVREKRREEMEAALARLIEATEDRERSPEDLDRLAGQAGRKLRELGELPPRQRGRLAKRIKTALAAANERLDEYFDVVKRRKQKLIDEADALVEAEVATAVAGAKELQQRWKEAGHLRRKDEQQMWKQFRKHCDRIFERRSKQNQEQKQETDQLREDLASKIAALSDRPDATEGEIGELSRMVDELGPRGRDLRARLNAAIDERDNQLAAASRKEAEQERKRLEKLAELCLSAETGNTIEQQQWSELGGDELDDDHPLARRWQRNSGEEHSDPGNQEELARELCIEVEFLAGVETPAAERAKRMDFQVQRLSERMSGARAALSAADEANLLHARWLGVGPLEPATRDELEPRFREAFKQLNRQLSD